MRASSSRRHMSFMISILLMGCFLVSCSTAKDRARPEEIWDDSKLIAVAHAVDRTDLAEIDRLIKAGADLNLKGKHDETVLVYAIGAKNTRAFEHLLIRGANPNVQIKRLNSIIHATAYSPLTSEWLEILLKHGADPNFESFDHRTPIFDAIYGRKENLDLLIKAGANIEHRNHIGETALLSAAGSNFYDRVHYLLERGANFRVKNEFGQGLEFYVITSTIDPKYDGYKWREKVIQFLLDRGVDFKEAEQQVAKHSPSALPRWYQQQEGRRAKKAEEMSSVNPE